MVKSIEKGLTNLDNEVIFYDVADKIVVVDDTMDDKTVEVAEKLQKNNSNKIVEPFLIRRY